MERETYREIPLLVQGKLMLLSQKNPFNRITRNDLNFHPYQVHTQQALEARDPPRIEFCHWLLGRLPRFVVHTLIGDEAAFFINGKVNTWNMQEYAPKNNVPALNYNISNNRQKVMVWVGLKGNNTII